MSGFVVAFIQVFISGLTSLLTNSALFYFVGIIVVFCCFLLLKRIISWR